MSAAVHGLCALLASCTAIRKRLSLSDLLRLVSICIGAITDEKRLLDPPPNGSPLAILETHLRSIFASMDSENAHHLISVCVGSMVRTALTNKATLQRGLAVF